jgi:hypothetical protein
MLPHFLVLENRKQAPPGLVYTSRPTYRVCHHVAFKLMIFCKHFATNSTHRTAQSYKKKT